MLSFVAALGIETLAAPGGISVYIPLDHIMHLT